MVVSGKLLIDKAVQVSSNTVESDSKLSQHCLTCCCRAKKPFLPLEEISLPTEHDYIIENDFDVLVNANHDYYSRTLQRAEDELSIDHCYAFQLEQLRNEDDLNCNQMQSIDGEFLAKNGDIFSGNYEKFTNYASDQLDFNFGAEMWIVTDEKRLDQNDIANQASSEAYLSADIPTNCEEIIGCSSDRLYHIPESEFSQDIVLDSIIFEDSFLGNNSRENLASKIDCKWKNCKLNFPNVKQLLEHLSQKHIRKNQPVYQCGWHECKIGMDFSKKFLLLRHLKIHLIESREFECNICHKCFPSLARLNEHSKRHSTEPKKHRCNFCSKKFAFSCDYKRHLVTHKKVYNFECKQCGSVYKDASGLRKHTKLAKCQHLDFKSNETGLCKMEKELRIVNLLETSKVLSLQQDGCQHENLKSIVGLQ